MANEFQDAIVVVGIPGLNGGGVTNGALAAAIAGVAPGTATYITQTPNGTLSAEQALSSLATGILKNTTTTGVLSIATGADLPVHTTTGVVTGAGFLMDGGGIALVAGVKGDLLIPFAGTITGYTLLPDQSGSLSIGVWKDTYANYPPVVGDLLLTLTLTATTKAQVTGLSHAVAAGDILRFNLTSATSVQRVSIMLTMTRSV